MGAIRELAGEPGVDWVCVIGAVFTALVLRIKTKEDRYRHLPSHEVKAHGCSIRFRIGSYSRVEE